MRLESQVLPTTCNMSSTLLIIQALASLQFAVLYLSDDCHNAGMLHGEAVLVRDRGTPLEAALAEARSDVERLALKRVYARPDMGVEEWYWYEADICTGIDPDQRRDIAVVR